MTTQPITRKLVEQLVGALENLQQQYSQHPDAFWEWSKGRAALTEGRAALASEPAPSTAGEPDYEHSEAYLRAQPAKGELIGCVQHDCAQCKARQSNAER